MRQSLRFATCAALAMCAISAARAGSLTMGAGCGTPDDSAAQMRADAAWLAKIVAFSPQPWAESLRVKDLREQAEQVLLAKSGIRRTCSDYRDGRLSQADADNILSGFEQTIRDFIHGRGNDALVRAASGKVTDMDSIRTSLTAVAGVGRQAALLGLNAIADEAVATMVKTLNTFDAALARDCKNQSFDANIIAGLLQQEGVLGLHNPLEPCAYRLARFTYTDARAGWSLEHCGPGFGTWAFSENGSGLIKGSGTGETDMFGNGSYSVRYTQFRQYPASGREQGTLKFYCTPEDACQCWKDPSTKFCLDRYGGRVPDTQWLLDFGLKSQSGSIKMRNASIPWETMFRYGVFATGKQMPVVYKRVDKPCEPK